MPIPEPKGPLWGAAYEDKLERLLKELGKARVGQNNKSWSTLVAKDEEPAAEGSVPNITKVSSPKNSLKRRSKSITSLLLLPEQALCWTSDSENNLEQLLKELGKETRKLAKSHCFDLSVFAISQKRMDKKLVTNKDEIQRQESQSSEGKGDTKETITERRKSRAEHLIPLDDSSPSIRSSSTSMLSALPQSSKTGDNNVMSNAYDAISRAASSSRSQLEIETISPSCRSESSQDTPAVKSEQPMVSSSLPTSKAKQEKGPIPFSEMSVKEQVGESITLVSTPTSAPDLNRRTALKENSSISSSEMNTPSTKPLQTPKLPTSIHKPKSEEDTNIHKSSKPPKARKKKVKASVVTEKVPSNRKLKNVPTSRTHQRPKSRIRQRGIKKAGLEPKNVSAAKREKKGKKRTQQRPTLGSWGIGRFQQKLQRNNGNANGDDGYESGDGLSSAGFSNGCFSAFTGMNDLVMEARQKHHGSSDSVGSNSVYTGGDDEEVRNDDQADLDDASFFTTFETNLFREL